MSISERLEEMKNRVDDGHTDTVAYYDTPALLDALQGVVAAIGPHYGFQLRRSERYGRTGSDCVCDACTAMRAIEDALEVKGL